MVVYLSAQGKKKKQTVFLNALLCIAGLLKYGHNWGFQNEGDNSVQLRDYLNSTIFFFIYWYFRAIKYNKPCSNRRGAVTISCPPALANQKTEDMTLARLSTVTLTKFCVEFWLLNLIMCWRFDSGRIYFTSLNDSHRQVISHLKTLWNLF